MSLKKGKRKSGVGADNAPPEVVRAQVTCGGSVNAPARSRMGHASYVHPKSGLLYVVGGCDVTALPQTVKSAHPDALAGEMPFAEWWSERTHTWGAATDLPASRPSQSLEEKAKTVKEDVQRGDAMGTEAANSRSDNSTTPNEPDVINTRPVRLPDGFTWPRLAAAVVLWELAQRADLVIASPTCGNDKPTWPNENQRAGDKATNDADNGRKVEGVVPPLPREHPVVLFIGGWTGTNRISQTIGVDMDSGTLLQFRSGTPSSFSAVTCLTGSAFQDHVYVFGGNTNGGYLPLVMGELDISKRKWCDPLGGEVPVGNSHQRSSHVAGLLLNRYIVIHGGRRQAQPVSTTQKGKKAEPKGLQSIVQLGLEFCTDVMVHRIEEGQWKTTTINVGSQGPAPRYGHAACVLGPSELLLHGGIGACGKVLSDAWILRLCERGDSNPYVLWIKVISGKEDAEPLPARYNHALTASERRVYITGGVGGSENADDVYILDIDPLPDTAGTPVESRRRTLTQRDLVRTRA